MSYELERQRAYWNGEVANFDSIYTHAKGTLATLLDRMFRRDMYERFDYTMRNAEPIAGRAFLDVGCGTGRYALELSRRHAKSVLGLDISEKMIEACRDRATAEGLDDRTTFESGDLLSRDDAHGFDCCLGIGLFDYIRHPLPLLTRMKECATDSVILSFPRRWTWRAPVRKARLALRGCYVRFYTLPEVIRLLRQAGFRSYDVEPIGKLYCVTA